jgi:hypothetical protein
MKAVFPRRRARHAFESIPPLEIACKLTDCAYLEIFNKTLEKCDEVLCFSDVARYRLIQQIVRKHWSGVRTSSVFVH